MLYDRWRKIQASSPNQIALSDLASGQQWTFAELARAAEERVSPALPVAFPSGQSAQFVLEVLRAWRTGRVVCPLEPGQTPPVLPASLPAGIAHLKTTSASTERARLVAFTPEQLCADALNIVATMGLRPEWPNVGLISLAHSYGFSNLVLPLLLHGVPLLIAGAALPEALRHAAQQAEAVTIAGVPALWRTWLQAGAIPQNVRLAISAGAPLPLELEQAVFAHQALKIHNFYGSSECGGIAYDASELPRTEAACTGAPLRNVQVSVAPNGCVEVRGAAVGQTYWPEARPNLGAGVFRSSDLGELRGGLLYLRGRAGDQINVAGRKVLPEIIERALAAHPQVRACLAFGVPGGDVQRGETIVACVASERALTGDALKQFALEHLPAWQVPRAWWFVDALEANQRGKLSRAEWRARYLQKNAEPPPKSAGE
jgi:long-chain acyl-CoA synthetase